MEKTVAPFAEKIQLGRYHGQINNHDNTKAVHTPGIDFSGTIAIVELYKINDQNVLNEKYKPIRYEIWHKKPGLCWTGRGDAQQYVPAWYALVLVSKSDDSEMMLPKGEAIYWAQFISCYEPGNKYRDAVKALKQEAMELNRVL